MEGRRPRPGPPQDQARRLSSVVGACSQAISSIRSPRRQAGSYFSAGSPGCLLFFAHFPGMQEFFKPLFDWYTGSLESGGYLMVALLMAMESTIFPLPSELIIPPAMIVAQRTGNMTLTGIVI